MVVDYRDASGSNTDLFQMTRFVLSALWWCLLAVSAQATTYYISTTGSDSNPCSISQPCATPNYKNVNGGDIFYVEAGSYSASWSNFGTVSGGSANNQAKFYCQTFFACNLACSYSSATITVDQSYWDVEGFNVTCNGPTYYGACIEVNALSGGAVIHHITIANNITANCTQNGITTGSLTFGSDYIIIQNNIVYNAAIANSQGTCPSGIEFTSQQNSDYLPGVHSVVRGNFAYSNINSWHSGTAYCYGTNLTTNGGGIIVDTPSAGGYTGLILVEDNITVGNGWTGITCTACTVGQIIIRNNTSWGDDIDPKSNGNQLGEMLTDNSGAYIQQYNNIAEANVAKCCALDDDVYGLYEANGTIYTGAALDIWDWNVAYNSAVGGSSQSTAVGGGSYTFGSHNILSTNPNLSAPFVPSGAPPCTTSDANVVACLQNASEWGGTSIIAAFTPTNSAVVGAGSHFFCAPSDILGNPWTGKCDPGAIKVSP